ncbi:signal-regulatory protein beta-1-like [Hyperolius riggenbachi]|uniref:signal-regulatory protein beta-1-like n=1 Tax=Hyperolius riggenbachi TaxID=752182 RepID=UPI0035A3B3BC
MGTDVTIPCSFTVNAPPINQRQVAIFWYFQGKEVLRFQSGVTVPADPRMSYTGRAQEGAANLIISNVTIIDGGIYKCSVLYASERGEKEVRLDIQAPPQITITDKLVLEDKERVLQSSVSGFYPVDIDIKWFRDGETLNNVIVEKPQRLPDGTYSVTSSVTVTPTEKDRRRTFSCRVQHESLAQPLQEDFTLVYGALPTVQITSQTFKLNVEQDLVCSASGYYPESIAVKWFLNGTLVESTKTQRINSSAVESVYRFLPTNENWGMEITCEVEHETLSSPRAERLLVTGPDLKAAYRTHTISAAVFLACGLAAVIIVVLLIKHKRTRLPKVRHITRSGGGFFSLDVHHFYPEDITVSWAVIQPPSSLQPHPIDSTNVRHQNQDGTFNATSTSESLRGVIREDEPYIVTAEVKHNKLKRPVQREWDSDDKENKVVFNEGKPS